MDFDYCRMCKKRGRVTKVTEDLILLECVECPIKWAIEFRNKN